MSLANGSAASLNGAPGNYSLVSIQQTGLVTITFFVSENSSENYKAATVTLVVDVVKVNQNISLNTAPPNFKFLRIFHSQLMPRRVHHCHYHIIF